MLRADSSEWSSWKDNSIDMKNNNAKILSVLLQCNTLLLTTCVKAGRTSPIVSQNGAKIYTPISAILRIRWYDGIAYFVQCQLLCNSRTAVQRPRTTVERYLISFQSYHWLSYPHNYGFIEKIISPLIPTQTVWAHLLYVMSLGKVSSFSPFLSSSCKSALEVPVRYKTWKSTKLQLDATVTIGRIPNTSLPLCLPTHRAYKNNQQHIGRILFGLCLKFFILLLHTVPNTHSIVHDL